MADEAKEVKMQTKAIDLSFTINKDGLTGLDLLTTLMRELNKHEIGLAGVLVSADPETGFQIFGHASKELENWPVEAMREAVKKYDSSLSEKHVQRISGKVG